MTLETGKPIGKDFLYNFLFKKDILPPFSSELILIFLLVRPYPFSPFDPSKIRLMRPLQGVQDIGQLRPFGMKRILPYNMLMETTAVEDSED